MKQRTAGGHFRKYAANTPNIDGARVAWRSQENLRRSVPESDHFMCVDSNRYAEGSCETEIGQLYDTVEIDKQILRFQIAMHCAPLMAVQNALRDLMQIAFD